jgi:ubiquinone/menaquinone biosynthesis C-methylase UbiE
MTRQLIILLILAFQNSFGQPAPRLAELSETEYGFTKKDMYVINDFFEYKKNFENFFNVKNGETIAELGAGDGSCSFAISLIYDSLKIYLEEFDSKTLNSKTLNTINKKYNKLKGKPQTNTFEIAIGSFTSTNLPDNTFDKIFMFQAFHEFTFADEMLNDIVKKLKPNGKVIVLDAFSLKDKEIKCQFGHRGLKIDETIEIFKRHGFYLAKMKSPETNIVNYANALVFDKNSIESTNFNINYLQVSKLKNTFALLDSTTISRDSKLINLVSDTLYNYLSQINYVYSAFECWVKDIALKNLNRKDFISSINILNVNSRLYPNSFENYYWLGVTYQESGNKEQALINFNKSLQLRPDNQNCIDRINKLKK